jgi:hypothetical protein
MSEGDSWFIKSLSDRSKSDDDISSTIDVLEVILPDEALPALVVFIGETSRSLALRERAAELIRAIGAQPVSRELTALAKSERIDVRNCARIALHK